MSELNDQIRNERRDFEKGELEENSIAVSAIEQFEIWMKQAVDFGVKEPYAMVLSTVGTLGQPSSRVLYLREIQEEEFIFYTNYKSRKGEELKENAKASLLFFWPELERQIRVEGEVQLASKEISDNYYNARPRKSKIGAWASAQSSVIQNREELEDQVKKMDQLYEGKEVPRPDFWGGYIFKPSKIEFWQGRPSRLHDRIVYEKQNESWNIKRIAP